MESLSPSTINVRLSAVRKLVGEARRAGMLGSEEAASLTDIPNISQKGTRLGNWLTREQAKELLAVPDRSTLKGKRDYVILALLVGCALRRIRTVAIPIWVKQGINAWMIAAGIEDGRLLRSVSKSGKINGDTLSDWAVWSIVEQSSKQIGIVSHAANGAWGVPNVRVRAQISIGPIQLAANAPRRSATSAWAARSRSGIGPGRGWGIAVIRGLSVLART